jgi:hypothetical protein
MRSRRDPKPLPARPTVTRTVGFGDADSIEVHVRLAAGIESTPNDAVVQLRVTGDMLGDAHRDDAAGHRWCTHTDARDSHG